MAGSAADDDAEAKSVPERVAELERENRELRALVDALHKKINRIDTLLVGERELAAVDEELTENFHTRLERHDEELTEVAAEARSAFAKASRDGANNSGKVKKDVAKDITRNELVRQAVTEWSNATKTVSEVQTHARPSTELAYQTVKDAFHDLQAEWGAIVVGENENGTRQAKIRKDALTKELVAVVERDLGRDDLTKKLISHKEKEGGS